jgi:glycosyltransferase involved in cell wall biosynthesis
MVSVLILTHNEEANLPRCLKGVEWSDDVVVLDSGSGDRTREVAIAHGARFEYRPFDNFADQRNYALDNFAFTCPWVLHLDADEVVTPELRAEIAQAVQSAHYDAFRIPSKLIFFGKWIKHASMYPVYQARLGRSSVLRFKQVGHGQRENLPPDRVGTLTAPYLHFSFSKGMSDWFAKHNRYSDAEALASFEFRTKGNIDWNGLIDYRDPLRRRRALKDLAAAMPMRAFLRFLYMYLIRMGFIDGRAGFAYCCLVAIYEYMIAIKVRELRLQMRDETGPIRRQMGSP